MTLESTDSHRAEVLARERFEFGANWARFLSLLDDSRIAAAQESLSTMLRVTSLDGLSFLDVGAGSGLFSLAARRLGARVTSFDYDPQSVACEDELRRRFFANDPLWTVTRGSVLDRTFLAGLGTFDVVYSWGVLHHTGQMWQALENAIPLVADGGTLFIAIYNDQGAGSRRWLAVKKVYNHLPRLLKPLLVVACGAYFAGRSLLRGFAGGRSSAGNVTASRTRGMSLWYDLVDWVGGYPFEVAKPEEILRFYRDRGFELVGLTTCGGRLGCNEYVFKRFRAAAE